MRGEGLGLRIGSSVRNHASGENPRPSNAEGCGTRHKVSAKHLDAYLDEFE